jgi:hypothetical protein
MLNFAYKRYCRSENSVLVNNSGTTFSETGVYIIIKITQTQHCVTNSGNNMQGTFSTNACFLPLN